MKYKLKDLTNDGFMEKGTFNNKKEILDFLLDDFLNFRMGEHNLEDLSLNYMLEDLDLKIIETEEDLDLDEILLKKLNSIKKDLLNYTSLSSDEELDLILKSFKKLHSITDDRSHFTIILREFILDYFIDDEILHLLN